MDKEFTSLEKYQIICQFFFHIKDFCWELEERFNGCYRFQGLTFNEFRTNQFFNIHHILPIHLFPDKEEFDKDNLIIVPIEVHYVLHKFLSDYIVENNIEKFKSGIGLEIRILKDMLTKYDIKINDLNKMCDDIFKIILVSYELIKKLSKSTNQKVIENIFKIIRASLKEVFF